MGVLVVLLEVLLVILALESGGGLRTRALPEEGPGPTRNPPGMADVILEGPAGSGRHLRRSLQKEDEDRHPGGAPSPYSSNRALSHVTPLTRRLSSRGSRARKGGGSPGGRNVSWAYRQVTWTLENFPDPRTDPERCGRRQASRVCDPNRLLTKSEGRKLDRVTAAICAHTGCPCGRNCSSACPGYKVGVAVIPSVSAKGDFRPDQSKPGAAAETQWAHNLRTQAWSMGTCSDDVILVLADREKKVFLSIGKRAKLKLTNACAESVNQDAQRHLEAGRVGTALVQMVKDIKSVFHDDFKCEISFSQAMSTGQIIGIIFGSIGPIILIVVILIFLGPCFGGKGFGGSSGSKHQAYHRRGYEQAETVVEGGTARCGNVS